MYRKKNYELKAPCAKSFSILRLFPFADVNLASGWRILAKSTGGHRQPSIDVRIVGFVFCKCKCKKILLAILKIRDSFALRIIEPFQGKKEKNFEGNFHLKKKRCLTGYYFDSGSQYQYNNPHYHDILKKVPDVDFLAIKWIENRGTRYKIEKSLIFVEMDRIDKFY